MNALDLISALTQIIRPRHAREGTRRGGAPEGGLPLGRRARSQDPAHDCRRTGRVPRAASGAGTERSGGPRWDPADRAREQTFSRAGRRSARRDAARTGWVVGEREPVDLVTLAQEICAHDTVDRSICRVEASAPVVGAYDRRRVEQLLQNLVENARKYSPDLTPIKINVWQEDSEARLAVQDSGIGIPAADLPRIFERFSRASNVDDKRFHGMGLGLFICRGIVEEHRGRIGWKARSARVRRFHVALPIADGRRLN